MQLRATRAVSVAQPGARKTLAQQFRFALASLRSAGVSITNQLLADQWAYQQRALALYPGQPHKCVLFQDAAGTTPVTAVEQPIGLALDLETAGTWDGVTALTSLPGTHMRQNFNTAKRAMFSARVNLLQRTEEFSHSAWEKFSGVVVVGGAYTAPNGETTATLVSGLAAAAGNRLKQVAVSLPSAPYTSKIWLKAGPGEAGKTVVISLTRNVGAAASSTAAVVLTDSWQEVSRSVTLLPDNTSIRLTVDQGTADSCYIWGADLRLSVDVHPSIPAYQRVTTATDYDTAGFPVYKRFDGVDDAYASINSLNLTGTDEVTAFAPITKESDAAAAVLELSASSSANNGVAILAAGLSSNSWKYSYGTKGTLTANAVSFSNAHNSPNKSVLVGIGKISTDTALLRVNGVQAASSTADQGTGSYGNYILYEGARSQTTVYFRGESQGFLLLGKNLTASQLAIVERYINQLWRAY